MDTVGNKATRGDCHDHVAPNMRARVTGRPGTCGRVGDDFTSRPPGHMPDAAAGGWAGEVHRETIAKVELRC